MKVADLTSGHVEERDARTHSTTTAMSDYLLQVREVACFKEKNSPIFSKVNFTVNPGDVVVIQGKSGSGSDARSHHSFYN